MLQRKTFHRVLTCILAPGLATAAVSMTTGCQDGPLYALKAANPYYSLRQWRADEAFGKTGHTRRMELIDLGDTIASMPVEQQQAVQAELEKTFDEDPNVEMRRLAIRAAGGVGDATALTLIEKGLDDESIKVRTEACRALANRSEPEAVRLLAATLGTEVNEDVRHSAMTALANYQDPAAVDALKLALRDRDPATRSLAVTSLKSTTGQDHGDDPAAWIAALETPTTPTSDTTRIAQSPETSDRF